MKILYIVDYYQPQLGYGSYYIPKELVNLGHKVIILTSNRYYPFPNYTETAGKILGKRTVHPGTTHQDRVKVIRKPIIFEVFTRAVFWGHEDIIKKFKPDLVVVDKSAGFSAILVSLWKRKYNYKLVSVDAHLPSGFRAEGNLIAKELFYFLFRLVFSNLINQTTDKFIAVQEDTEDIMRRYYGIKHNIVHIPLGTDVELYKFNKYERGKVRNEYRIGIKDFVIIYTGKIIIEKGVHLLFSAFNILCPKYENVRVLILGSGSQEYIDFCLSKLNKKYYSKIVWAGFKPAQELFKFYSAADVGVWPLQESMSMNDAASCSLVFIANDEIGARVRLGNKNALLYKKGNVMDLKKKIEYLYLNPQVRKSMGRRGRELVKNKLSWSKIASEYISV